MKRSGTTKISYFIVLALLVLAVSSCTIIPTVNRTRLMHDVRESRLSISAGTEIPLGEATNMVPDPLFETITYAPTDWLEVGIEGHWGIFIPALSTKVDLVNLAFNEDLPISILLSGAGALYFDDEDTGIFAHGSVAANYRPLDFLEVYAGVGSSTLSKIPSIQAGVNVLPVEWLSLAADLKISIDTLYTEDDTLPVALMISLSPGLSFDLSGDKE